MPTPQFILDLRKKVGHDFLLLPGLVAVVIDGDGRVLMNRRSDTGGWSLISGILEPDEQPAAAMEREVFEETALRVKATRLLDAWMSPRITYHNGDQTQYLTVAYRCEVIGGEPRVNDDESVEVKFFSREEMPALRPDLARCVELAFEKSTKSTA